MSSEIRDLQDAVSAVESLIDDLRATIEGLKEDRDKFESDLGDKDKECEDLKRELASAEHALEIAERGGI